MNPVVSIRSEVLIYLPHQNLLCMVDFRLHTHQEVYKFLQGILRLQWVALVRYLQSTEPRSTDSKEYQKVI